MRKLATIIGSGIILGAMALPALAATTIPVTLNLCQNGTFYFGTTDGVNLNALMSQTDHCKKGGKLNLTIDLCSGNVHFFGYGNHDKSLFMRNTGQCK